MNENKMCVRYDGWNGNCYGAFIIQNRPKKYNLPVYELWAGDECFSTIYCVNRGSAWWLREDALNWPSRKREELTIVDRKSGTVVFQMVKGVIVIDEVKRK